jgi:hypothetical protein
MQPTKNACRTSCRDPVELELTEEDHRLELFGVTLQRLTILRLYPTTLNHLFCCVADGAEIGGFSLMRRF